MFDLKAITRENIRKMEPYTSARDEHKGNGGILLDANENPFGDYNRYPDPQQKELKKLLSGIKQVSCENIFLGNGSDEVIDLLYRVFCEPHRHKAMIFSPTYGMYQVLAEINAIGIIDVPLNGNFQIDIEAVKPGLKDSSLRLIFICSPNNPTGNFIHTTTIEYLLSNFKGLVVVDEAYIDFGNETSLSSRIDEFPNLVVVQTLSKAYGMAGLRIGMALAEIGIIALLNKVKPPYNLSSANQAAALKMLRNQINLSLSKGLIASEKLRLWKELRCLPIIEHIYPSETNFILVKVGNARKVYERLLKRNLLVRNRHASVKNTIRITVGSPTENETLIRELKAIDDEKGSFYR